MGFFNRTRSTTNLPSDPASTLGRGDILPADTMGRVASRGSAIADKATQIYKQNPKLIGGLALVASALLLNRMKRPHH